MLDRATPRTIPERRPYLCIELGDYGPHHVRVPSVLAVAQILRSLERLHIAALVAIDGDSISDAMALRLLRDAGPELISILGAILGKAWHHETRDLEATADGDMMTYGEAVWEELHGEGYSFEALVLLSMTVITEIKNTTTLSAEARNLAGFFGQPRGLRTSSTSTSESTTSTTPPGGIA